LASSRPVISSVSPSEYTSAVSKNITPASTARATIGSAASSGRCHARSAVLP